MQQPISVYPIPAFSASGDPKMGMLLDFWHFTPNVFGVDWRPICFIFHGFL
jgi:hypothetical protein